MKKGIIGAIVIVIAVFIGVLICNKSYNNITECYNVNIKQYEFGTDNLIKDVQIDQNVDLENLKNFINQIKPLSKNELVDKIIANCYNIEFNDSYMVGFDDSKYCLFINSNDGASYMSYMPKGLYEWTMEKLNLGQ